MNPAFLSESLVRTITQVGFYLYSVREAQFQVRWGRYKIYWLAAAESWFLQAAHRDGRGTTVNMPWL